MNNLQLYDNWSKALSYTSWITFYLFLGQKKFERVIIGESVLFTDGGDEHREQWIHSATIDKLEPRKNYFYR